MKQRHGTWLSGIASIVAGMVVGLVLILGGATTGLAQELTQTELFFELNDTDKDLGIHANLDGDAYVRLKIEDPQGRTILNVTAQGRLAKQGLTQLSLESAEPSFDELLPKDFFKRFPEGWYEIEAVTADGEEMEARVKLSHILAAPPANIKAGGVDGVKCDEAVPDVGAAGDPVLVVWDLVTMSHPTVGTPNKGVKVSRHQFFVEQGPVKLGVDLPPTVTAFEVPGSITALGGVFKYEIITRTMIGNNPAGNNTAVELCFQVH